MVAQSYDLKEIDAELCRKGNEDQEIRKKMIEAAQNQSPDFMSIASDMKSIDSKNQEYVSNLLDNHGWSDKLSDCANRAIFYVILHAQENFSGKYITLAKEKADKGVIQKSDVATLEDKILMKSLKPQKYGTQSISKKTENGEDAVYIWPIEDNEKVDELRASVGLPPMDTYLQLAEKQTNRKYNWDKNLTVSDFNNDF